MPRTHATFYNDRITVTATNVSNKKVQPPKGSGARWHRGFKGLQRQRICRAADFMVTSGACDFVTVTFPMMERQAQSYAPVRVKYLEEAPTEPIELPNGGVMKGTRPQRVFICAQPCINVIDDAEARRRLKAFIRALGVSTFLWVAEVQPSRLQKHGQRAVHFHCLLPRIDGELDERRAKVQEVWKRVQNNAGDLPEHVITDIVECYGTPGAYLAKYIAKGDEDGDLLPLSMWIQGNGYGTSHDITEVLKPVASMTAEGLHVDELTEFVEVAVYALGGEYRRVDGRMWSSMEWGHNKKEYSQIFWEITQHLLSSGIKCNRHLNENYYDYPRPMWWGCDPCPIGG